MVGDQDSDEIGGNLFGVEVVSLNSDLIRSEEKDSKY